MLRLSLIFTVLLFSHSNNVNAQNDPFAGVPSDPFAPTSMNITAIPQSEMPTFEAYKADPIDADVHEITPEELHDALGTNEKIYILDTRQEHEYETSHIKNAQRVGYTNFSSEKVWPLDRDTRIVVYSALNKRGLMVAQYLKLMGFTDIQMLDGGLISWKNDNFDVYDAKGKTDKIHVGGKGNLRFVKRGRAIL